MYRESFTVVAQLPALTVYTRMYYEHFTVVAQLATVVSRAHNVLGELDICSTAGKFTELTIICTVIDS
jgi:hypothetical protein